MLMNAGASESACAGADGHFSLLEMSEEGVPFFFGRCPVFFAGAGRAPSGDERPVRLDRLSRIDCPVSYGRVDAFVAADELRDVGWQPAHDGVGHEHPAEIVGRKVSGSPLVSVSPVAASALMSSLRIAVGVNARRSLPI